MVGLFESQNTLVRLRNLLKEKAILHRQDGHSIVDYSGKPMSWIYYLWGVSLSPVGADLLSQALIDRLWTFRSNVVASIGMTGAPLIGSLVAISNGRYTGLCIRKEREKHGTQRLIEGVADKSQSVVIVDDCVCSGNSLKNACVALEAEGYRIEGVLTVVNFPYRGGSEWARALGLRFEALFDIWEDLQPDRNRPPKRLKCLQASSEHRVPENLSPADAARWVMEFFFRTGQIPAAPQQLSGGFCSSGGVMVSFRDRVSDKRIARNGFYRLKKENHFLASDVIAATATVLRSSADILLQYGPARLKIGVTLFGPHAEIEPSGLDFSRYGILVCSRFSPDQHGGALPNTQFFTSEIEQFRHARFTNAKLMKYEPFQLFRHEVSKSIETGMTWPTFGISIAAPEPQEEFAVQAVDRVREWARTSKGAGSEPQSPLIPPSDVMILGVAISFYQNGLVGCWTSFRGTLDEMLREATTKAWEDDRYTPSKATLSPESADIVLSVFYGCERLGTVSTESAANKVRLGKDSLFVSSGDQSGFILAHIPIQYDWDRRLFAQSVLRKAKLTTQPCRWTTYATKSWLHRNGNTLPMESGYPARSKSARIDTLSMARRISTYISSQLNSSGIPSYSYHPILNKSTTIGSSVRTLLALEALIDAAEVLGTCSLRGTANAGLASLCDAITVSEEYPTLRVPGANDGISADVALVSAVYRTQETNLLEHPLLGLLRCSMDRLFHNDGVIASAAVGQRMNIDHDLFPGSALRMAGRIATVEGQEKLPRYLSASLQWYRERFRLQRPWGMLWWQIQGWTAIYESTGDTSCVPFIYEMADWALQHQLNVSGAFLVDYSLDGPSFHTACVLEGIADAWKVALSQGDKTRAEHYEQSWNEGIRFMNRLTCDVDDTYAMPLPSQSVGGVRSSPTTSNFRIDFAAHTLSALCKGILTRRE